MPESTECSDEQLIQRADAFNARACAAQREMLRVIAEADRRELWRYSEAANTAHWVCLRYGISYWKALRWVAASHALEGLPLLSEAFASGELGIDKVVELTRFATPETEGQLIRWAEGVSAGRIRHQADLARRPSPEEAGEADRDRSVSWGYFDEGKRFGLHADLPAVDGPVVTRALDRWARSLPVMPGEEGVWGVEARRADALVALCSARIVQHPDPDRATIIIHARVGRSACREGSGEGGSGETPGQLHSCEIEGGPVIHPETARRLLCTSRVQVVLEDASGNPVRVGRMRREPPDWMLRQLRYRDRECQFPGCGRRGYLQAHHIVWWERGGRTDLDNLVLLCFFHHKLVHEYGWRIMRNADGEVRWFHPDGTRYRAGPGPPNERIERESDLTVKAI